MQHSIQMNTSFNQIVNGDEYIVDDIVRSHTLVAIPILCSRDDWWFDHPAGRRFNEADDCVSPFLGVMNRLEGNGWWMRELEFEGYQRSAATCTPGDREAEHGRTPVGSWVWLQSSHQALCYCNPASDVHVLCLGHEYTVREQLESRILISLRSTVLKISSIPDPRERQWHARFVLYHLSIGVSLHPTELERELVALAL